jgi:hypothetical protein
MIGLFDAIAVLVGVLVASAVESVEGYLLAAFFITTSLCSFFIFQTDAYVIWPYIFVVMTVSFGLMSLSHPVVIGYIMYLVVIGANHVYPVEYYSAYIYLIYLYQLGTVVYYGYNLNNNNHRTGFLDSSFKKHS